MGQSSARQRLGMTRSFALSLLFLMLTACAAGGQADGALGACEAALHDQRVIYESQLASLQQQLQSVGRENREARAQLVSLRARCSRVMEQDAQVVTGPPSNQSVPNGADGLGHGLRLLESSSFGLAAENAHSEARNLSSIYSSSRDLVSSPRPQIARGVVGRSLLQAEDRACSKAEAQAVLQAADPIPVVTEMLVTNPSCATCIIACAMKKGFGVVFCLHGCQHQAENRCGASTGLLRLSPLVGSAALDNRDSLVRLLLSAESDCKLLPLPQPPLLIAASASHPGFARSLKHTTLVRTRRREPRSMSHISLVCARGPRASVYATHVARYLRFSGKVVCCTRSMRTRTFDRTWSDPRVCASCTYYDCGFRRVLHPRHDRERLRRAMRPRQAVSLDGLSDPALEWNRALLPRACYRAGHDPSQGRH